MHLKSVKELMLPLDDYAVIHKDFTMIQAALALEDAQKKVPAGRQHHRAILITDDDGKIIGKLGHMAFLKALEPKYESMGDLGKLSSRGWSSDFLSSMMDNMRLWKESFAFYVNRAEHTKVKEVMHPVAENIEISAPLSEAVHKLVMYQTLSLLVIDQGVVVGVLRLSDVYTEIATKICLYAEDAKK